MNFRTKALAVLMLVISLAPFTPAVRAQTVTWGGSNGNWNVPADWTGGTAPGTGTNAIINSGTANLPSAVTGTASTLVIGNSTVGVVVVNNGSLGDVSAIIGNGATSSGSISIISGTWSNSSGLVIGNAGAGMVTVSGGLFTSASGTVGNLANSNGTVILNGTGTWTNAGVLTVGNSGTGTLSLSGSGMLTVNSGAGTLQLALNAGSAGTLDLGTGTAAGTLNAAVVNGGGGVALVNFNQNATYSFAPQLAGSISVNQLGLGTTILSGSNSYTGSTTISSGTLRLGNTDAAQNSIVFIGASNRLTFGTGISTFIIGGLSGTGGLILNDTGDNSVALTIGNNSDTGMLYSGSLSGTGTLVKTGSGIQTLNGSNGYTGNTTISTGTLQFAQIKSMYSTGTVTTGSGATLAVNAGGAGEFTSGTSGYGTIGGLFSGSGGRSGNVVNPTLGSQIGIDTTNAGGSLTYSGNITNPGVGLVKLGSGTLYLTGNNSYTGNTEIDSGLLNFTGSNTFTGNLAVNYGGVSVTGGGSINLGSGNMIIGNLNGNIAGLSISGGSIVTVSNGYVGNAAGTSSIATVDNSTWNNVSGLTIGGSGAGILDITGSGVVAVNSGTGTPVGSGTLLLAVNVGSSGTLNLGTGASAGTLEAAAVNGGAGVYSALGSAMVNFNQSGSYNFAPQLTGTLSINQIGSGTTVLTGSSSFYGNTFVNNGALNIAAGTSVTGSDAYIAGNVGSSAAVTINGTWNGTHGEYLYIGYRGTGTLNISGGDVNDVFSSIGFYPGSNGTVTVTNGTWNTTAGINVGDSGTGTFNLNGGYVNGGLGLGVNVPGASGSATISSGTLNGGIDVGVSGTGVLAITGGYVSGVSSTIGDAGTGTATMSSGTWNANTLQVGSSGIGIFTVTGGSITGTTAYIGRYAGSSGSSTISGGTWNTSRIFDIGYSGTGVLNLTGSGSVTDFSGTGTLQLGANAGSVGTLNLGTGSTAGTLNAAAVNGGSGAASVNFNQTGTYNFAPQLTGSLSVSKSGAGTTILTGSSSYTGSATVKAGTLTVDGSLIPSSGIGISSGAVLAGSGLAGRISGAGMLAPGGNAILTGSQVDPGSGMSFAFHFSQAGSPTYGNAVASGNDVLHLTGAAPLLFALTSANTVALDFTGQVLETGEIFYGGVFTDAAIANSMVASATFDYTGLNGATVQFEGMAPVPNAVFATGTVSNGEVMQFNVTGAPVPSAPAWALLATVGGLSIAAMRRIKAKRNPVVSE